MAILASGELRRRGVPGLLLVALASSLFAGCGSDSDSSEPTQGPRDSATEAKADASPAGVSAAPDFCTLLSAEDISAVVGGPVSIESAPLDGCGFKQDDPRALSGALGTTELVGNGGFETYQSGTTAALDSPIRHEFTGLGDAAYVDIGTVAGGENLQVAGGVLVGDRIHTLNLSQGSGLSESELVAVSEKLLQLALDAL